VTATSETPFHVPLDLAWKLGDAEQTRRVELQPGENKLRIPAGAATGLRLASLHGLLCEAAVTVQ
jgi:hypothetical protein